jgi:glycerol kinase
MSKLSNKLLLCIDQGTTSSKTALINGTLNIIYQNGEPQVNIYSKPGWSETNAEDLYQNVKNLCNQTISKYKDAYIKVNELEAIGITNQRESCLIWNRITGKPYCNALLWNDTRTSDIVDGLIHFNKGNIFEFKEITGLPISTYFSAFKFKYMIDNIPEIKEKIHKKDYKDLCFGTIDSWLIFNLTKGKRFVTDVTNASRTMLMNLDSLKWDSHMLNYFNIPEECLPEILSSSDDFGYSDDLDMNLPINGVIGDQQSACIGHSLQIHQVKNTYGTGGFLLMNTGEEKIYSKHGLLTTLLYKEKGKNAQYALEGSIEAAGNTLTWLKENLNLFKDYSELKNLFLSVEDSGDVYFVPSFSGIYSPYWSQSARGSIQGLTMNSTKGNIVRAAYEGVAYRTLDIINCFETDTDVKIHVLKVDGGMTNSEEFLQTQANIANRTVSVKNEKEITLIGSAVAAGIGSKLFDLKTVSEITSNYSSYNSKIDEQLQEKKYKKWKMAVERSLNWT